MCRFEDRIAAVVVDVGSRCDTDTANHSRQLVGDIIAVQVQCCDHRIFFRHEKGVLEKSVGNHIFDDDFSGCFGIQQGGSGGLLSFFLFDLLILRPCKGLVGEFAFRKRISP